MVDMSWVIQFGKHAESAVLAFVKTRSLSSRTALKDSRVLVSLRLRSEHAPPVRSMSRCCLQGPYLHACRLAVLHCLLPFG